MGVQDVRKCEKIILTDGHPRGLHMKRRRTKSIHLYYARALAYLLPLQGLHPVLLFRGREVGNIFDFRAKIRSVFEEEKVLSQRGDKRRERETTCRLVTL